MAVHDYCTEDDCPCFAAGEEGIIQIRRDYIEKYENRLVGRWSGRGRDTDD